MIVYGEMIFFISVGTLEFGHVNIILEYEFSVMMIIIKATRSFTFLKANCAI